MARDTEKPEYYDDGRTIADMSNVGHSPWYRKSNPYKPPVRFKDAWNTYWNAVKMMLVPLLVVSGAIGVIYVVITLLFRLAY